MLLAVDFPDLVDGVIASVPSSVALCAYPGCGGPAWTLDGKPVPYTRQVNQPHPTDDPGASIAVERTAVPYLFDCAGADTVWHSCDFAQALVARLDVAHDPRPHDLLAYPDAGHAIGFLLPFEPGGDDVEAALHLAGRTADANDEARRDLWPHVLAFLDQVARS